MKTFEQYCCEDCNEHFDHQITEAEYQGTKVKLNDPIRVQDGKSKFKVYTKNEKGNVVMVRFGDPNMEIKRDDPGRRASFRARQLRRSRTKMESTILVMLSMASRC